MPPGIFMKKLFWFIFLLPACLYGQNLVPNPGFENAGSLPCSWVSNNINNYLENWDSPTTGTPDLLSDQTDISCYGSCLSADHASRGSQEPHSGHNMIMITTYGGGGCEFPNYREYIGVKLSKALIPGQKYYAEMYVSLVDHCGFASNNIGMCLFSGTTFNKSDCVLSGNAQVNSTEVIDDANGWVKISGTFVADKRYTYLVIGNFRDGKDTKVKERPASVLNPYYNYWTHESAQYFVDDVLLRPENKLVVTGDTLVMAGATATLNADGCKTYNWADASEPEKIIARGPQLVTTMMEKRTFLVYSDCDTAEAVVDVFMPDKPEDLKAFNGRKIRKGKTIIITHDVITITLYDNNKEDGDSVSVWYGDSCIVQHLSLTHKKVTFTLHIDPTQPKAIILYAENQGSMPPNTAGVTITDGRKKNDIVLSSDLKTCDSVTLVYKEDD